MVAMDAASATDVLGDKVIERARLNELCRRDGVIELSAIGSVARAAIENRSRHFSASKSRRTGRNRS
jgi:hypothetical protein